VNRKTPKEKGTNCCHFNPSIYFHHVFPCSQLNGNNGEYTGSDDVDDGKLSEAAIEAANRKRLLKEAWNKIIHKRHIELAQMAKGDKKSYQAGKDRLSNGINNTFCDLYKLAREDPASISGALFRPAPIASGAVPVPIEDGYLLGIELPAIPHNTFVAVPPPKPIKVSEHSAKVTLPPPKPIKASGEPVKVSLAVARLATKAGFYDDSDDNSDGEEKCDGSTTNETVSDITTNESVSVVSIPEGPVNNNVLGNYDYPYQILGYYKASAGEYGPKPFNGPRFRAEWSTFSCGGADGEKFRREHLDLVSSYSYNQRVIDNWYTTVAPRTSFVSIVTQSPSKSWYDWARDIIRDTCILPPVHAFYCAEDSGIVGDAISPTIWRTDHKTWSARAGAEYFIRGNIYSDLEGILYNEFACQKVGVVNVANRMVFSLNATIASKYPDYVIDQVCFNNTIIHCKWRASANQLRLKEMAALVDRPPTTSFA